MSDDIWESFVIEFFIGSHLWWNVLKDLYILFPQVSALTQLSGGGIPATYLNSQQSATQKKAVFHELTQAFPSCKLLYVTPEQLVKSSTLVEILQKLDSRGLLSSLVIDEVDLACHLPINSICLQNTQIWEIYKAGSIKHITYSY